MAWVRWGFLLSFGLFLCPVCLSVEPQKSRSGSSGYRRLYVVQSGLGSGPGSVAGDSALRVTSVSTGHQSLMYNVELTAKVSRQIRTRRMGVPGNHVAPAQQTVWQTRQPQSQEPHQPLKQSGVNVCGGQCCHGWSATQGSQRCIKPNCIPQCQNGGMCLRPHLCVCKPGSKGQACEQMTVPTYPGLPGIIPTDGYTNGNSVVPQRPIPQQAIPNGQASGTPSAINMAQMKVTVKAAPPYVRPHYIHQNIQQQIRPIPIHSGQKQQYHIKPKYYHMHTTHTQTHVLSQPDQTIPLTVGHHPHALGNYTGRIKVVFTPTICKITCIGRRCHNNCEKGNTTTIISENGLTTDTLTAPNFRVVVCHLPCINGGKCSARGKCQCSPNFTGKFCQMSVLNGYQQTSGAYTKTQVQSTHTLPLTYSNGQTPVFNPGIVNIHIKHPPEASVQVHQVAQLDDYLNNGNQQVSQAGSSSSTSYIYHHTDNSQKIQHHSYNRVSHGYHVPQYQPVTSKNTLGRCFQETAAGQCGKALPGLTKQEQCCGSIGTSWGFHKCQKCPVRLSLPLIDCPQGYKRVNSSHCQDVDECQLQDVCPNGICVNTLGSYRCTCKPGYVPDPSLTTCMSNTPAVEEEKGACFRLVSSGRQCLHPVSTQLSKQLCCCSVGKAWGPHCYKCPPPGTDKFKEICPGGMGYTILPNKPVTVYQEPVDFLNQHPPPTTEKPVEAFGKPGEIIPEVIEKTSPLAPVEIRPSNAGQDIAPTQIAEVNECQINPYICGEGVCYNTAKSYTCHCGEGYRLDHAQNTCVDIDECHDDQICSRGHCQNTEGSFICHCVPGFTLSPTQDQCVDVDECQEEAQLCSPHGTCVNSDGSYLCVCDSGFTGSLNTPSCEDIDECGLNKTLCGPHGFCDNRIGSFQCLCDQGYQESEDGKGCKDVNECELLSSVCGEAECLNMNGSFLCVCPSGQEYNVMIAKCEPIPTVSSAGRKECYYNLNDENLCESVLTSQITLQECCCTLGAGWGDNCEVHPCPVNSTGQFNKMCPSGRGFIPNGDLLFAIPTSDSYRDADECTLFGQEVCKGGFCLNTNGSYECYCKAGHYYDPVNLECIDINECENELLCDGTQCVNTDGSYLCTCLYPLEMDSNSNRCVLTPELAGQYEPEQTDYRGICWQTVTESLVCTRPLGPNRRTTYTECCCVHGEAWGMECALCPPRDAEIFASMCNLPVGGGLQPYGRDALIAGPVHEFDVSQGYSPSPEQQLILPLYDNEDSYKAYEGLHAEECGILNGCENGRCVRVREGYTCDCFDGYSLDLSHMACTDVNECSELNGRMSLCKNAKCINTVGSYQCECLPGFRVSNKPNYCVEAELHPTFTQSTK